MLPVPQGVPVVAFVDTIPSTIFSPVKVLEPMLAGLPLVAHGVGQVTEFVGDAGVLVSPGDLGGMAEAVSALLADPERRERLGRMAQKRVWERFNWEQLCVAAEEAYTVAGRSRRKTRRPPNQRGAW